MKVNIYSESDQGCFYSYLVVLLLVLLQLLYFTHTRTRARAHTHTQTQLLLYDDSPTYSNIGKGWDGWASRIQGPPEIFFQQFLSSQKLYHPIISVVTLL